MPGGEQELLVRASAARVGCPEHGALPWAKDRARVECGIC